MHITCSSTFKIFNKQTVDKYKLQDYWETVYRALLILKVNFVCVRLNMYTLIYTFIHFK